MTSDAALFGLTIAQQVREEREDMRATRMAQLDRRYVPPGTFQPHPVEDLIEDIALGLTEDNPIVGLRFSYNQVSIRDHEWFLGQEEWERVKGYCYRHVNEGLAVDSFHQGGIAFRFTKACRERRKVAVAMAATNRTL